MWNTCRNTGIVVRVGMRVGMGINVGMGMNAEALDGFRDGK